LKHNGQSDGSNCRGLDEAQCATLGKKIKSSGYSMGTHYDRVRGGCVLNGVVTENAVNLVGEIAAGVALTLVTDGAALVPVVVSVGTDLAFAAVQDWQRKIPYSDYQDFLAHVMACSEDTTGILSDAVRISGIKSVENKYCLSETIRQDYQLVVGQMSLLAPEDQKILSDVFKNIVANMSGIFREIADAEEKYGYDSDEYWDVCEESEDYFDDYMYELDDEIYDFIDEAEEMGIDCEYLEDLWDYCW
jgi:hypothetical protein